MKDIQHVYAIVRIDDFLGNDVSIENRVTVKKVMWNADAAKMEVKRLQRLRNEPGVRYFVQTTRLHSRET